jgi:uncharacterized protein YbaP (TraB family)
MLRGLALAACFALSMPVFAQAPPQPAPPDAPAAEATPITEPPAIVDLDAVVVSGAQPGPGMWKVSKGGHVLYILGTLSPLPKRMEWISRDVEDTIARSQVVIAPPTVSMGSDIGFFRGLMLVPSLLKARNNPDGKPLRDMVPADLYARWLVLKARYMGSDRGVEKRRPIFAAQELYEAAMRKSGLTLDSVVGPVVKKAAKRAGVPIVPAEAKLVIKDPKSALKEFNQSALADTECFSGTLARIETDLDAMRARANAWAVGDIQALRALPVHNQYATCVSAVTETGLAKRLGVSDLVDRARVAWLAAAEDALAKNAVSFSTLPIGAIVGPESYVDRLREKGYEVEAP